MREDLEAVQATRERILDILKRRGQATVNELSSELGLTTVTIRHHLDTLGKEGLVAVPFVRRRKAPGRPQHVYTLTEESSDFFPRRYDQLADLLLEEVRAFLSADELKQVMQRIGRRLAEQVTFPDAADFEERLIVIVDYLSECGHMACLEHRDDGEYELHIANCPYEQVARRHQEVCLIDQAILSCLLDAPFERVERSAYSEGHCTYLIHPPGD